MSNYNLTLFELIERVTLSDDQAEAIFAALTERLDATTYLHAVTNAVRPADLRAMHYLDLILDGSERLTALYAEWTADATLDPCLRVHGTGTRRQLILKLRPTPRSLRAFTAYMGAAETAVASFTQCCDVRALRTFTDTDYAALPAFEAEAIFTDVRLAPLDNARTGFGPDETQAVFAYYNDNTLVTAARFSVDYAQPVRSDTPLWQIRERAKLAKKVYEELPASVAARLAGIADHELPHLSFQDPGKIAYTENARKGWHNIQSVARPGKYLRRYVKVTDQDLKELVAEVSSAGFMEIKFATDPEAIRDVYLNGPQSCMKYGEDTFRETVDADGVWHHPCEVYGDPDNDIELAYVADAKGQIGARALINTADKQYPALYASDYLPGALHVLRDWLDANGYEEDSYALRGQKLLRIDLRRGRILCPYIDRNNIGVEIHDDYLIAGGPHEAPHDRGYLFDEHTKVCDHCDERVHEDEMQTVSGGDEVCDSCISDDYVRAIDRYGDVEWVSDGDVTRLPHAIDHQGDMVHYVADDFDDWEMIGLCRLENGKIVDEDEAVETSDDEWIDRDVTIDEDDHPERLNSFTTHVIIDNVAYALGDCFWHDDDGCWYLCDDYDLLAMVVTGDHSYADPDEEALDSAA